LRRKANAGQHRNASAAPVHIAPTVRWRAQAIGRVVAALRELLPISHVVLCEPERAPKHIPPDVTPAMRREALIAAAGIRDADNRPIAACAYCGTTSGRIGVDHIRPESRGGTDSWDNLVLACEQCNQRKGDRLPEEAGMELSQRPRRRPGQNQRTTPYIRWTLRLLRRELAATDLNILDLASDRPAISDALAPLMQVALRHQDWQCVVARPVARPRKQRFTARNYPLATLMQSGMQRFPHTIKRRVRVNSALALAHKADRVIVRVIAVDEQASVPNDAQIITPGTLCAGRRAGVEVIGLVSAIHSSGRLTLLTPHTVSTERIRWRPVVISPRREFRVLSRDKVLFFRV
jgi:hypothetical protein